MSLISLDESSGPENSGSAKVLEMIPGNHAITKPVHATITALSILLIGASPAHAVDYAVRQDGSGHFTTIQACANTAKPGDACLVYPGTYDEHVKTLVGGTSDNRITFKALGTVTMQGFDIRHAYVTIDGFDITRYLQGYYGHITVFNGGHNCEIVNNTIRDGAANVYGIIFYPSSGLAANGCSVRDNRLSNLLFHFLSTAGDNHVFERNTLEYQNNMDYIRLAGANQTFRRNIFWRGSQQTGSGNHPDFVQVFGGINTKSENHLFEENWIQDLPSQFGQMNSGDGIVYKGVLYDNIKNVTFRRNVISNLSANANIGAPGVRFENNTFYRLAFDLSGIILSGSLTRGDASRATLVNNVFLAGGARASVLNDFSGYYSLEGAVFSREVLAVFVTKETNTSGSVVIGTIATAIYDSVVKNGYIDSNGAPQAKLAALTDASQLILASEYAAYRDLLYDYLMRSVALDRSIRTTFAADYNFVAGSASAGFPAKRSSGCISGETFTKWNFCEPHGINGGDPKLADIALPLGPDGIPFTLDDGLKPLAGSPLCGRGDGGQDIGAYSCDPGAVFPVTNTNTVSPPSSLRIVVR